VEAIDALLNIVVMVLIVSTMFAAGLSTTIEALWQTFRNIKLIFFVLVANLVLVQLVGWGTAEVLSLAQPAFIAFILVACSPGAPFAAKLAIMQRGDVTAGASLQVLLAAIGSVTFAPTANLIFSAAEVGGGGLSLPVGKLGLTVAVLQLLPFAVGLALNRWAAETASQWKSSTLQLSNLTLLAALALSLLGSWRQIIALIGSLTLLAALIFNVVAFGIGTLVASGSPVTRTTVGLLAPVRNAGPVFAAIAIAFNNDPEILAALTGILLLGLAVCLLLASNLARHRTATEVEAETRAPLTSRLTAPTELNPLDSRDVRSRGQA
jgi:bile acid:Na+ symporter, BASS family